VLPLSLPCRGECKPHCPSRGLCRSLERRRGMPWPWCCSSLGPTCQPWQQRFHSPQRRRGGGAGAVGPTSADDDTASGVCLPKVRRIAAPVAATTAPVHKGAPVPSSGGNAEANEEVQQLERAVAALRPDGFHGRLPCREAEQERISAHLRTAVRQGGSMQVLYVSGMPGTGKTASVLEAIRQMRGGKAVPPFEMAHVNAMRLGAPGAVFREVLGQLQSLGASRRAAAAAHGELARFFTERSGKDPVIVLLIDEIDHLVTQNQAVLYKVFDWLALPAPRLAIVAISNTMDLPERLLPRVASRFGIVRVDFEPYNRDQIFQILTERLQGHNANGCFAPTMLKLCAARVAAGSGDIRKALQLCRRAAEVRGGRHRDHGPVGLPHLEAAEKDLLHANPAARTISGLGPKARRFLVALLLELRRAEADAVPLRAASARYAKLLAALEAAEDDPRCAGGAPASAPFDPLQHSYPLDESAFLAQRLEAMALLARQPVSSGVGIGLAAGPVLALGAGLDAEDLATALKTAEDDAGILELLHDTERT